jgi:hypothetical protein
MGQSVAGKGGDNHLPARYLAKRAIGFNPDGTVRNEHML